MLNLLETSMVWTAGPTSFTLALVYHTQTIIWWFICLTVESAEISIFKKISKKRLVTCVKAEFSTCFIICVLNILFSEPLRHQHSFAPYFVPNKHVLGDLCASQWSKSRFLQFSQILKIIKIRHSFSKAKKWKKSKHVRQMAGSIPFIQAIACSFNPSITRFIPDYY